ncbi:MAG TPA: hypothetical protein VKZ99_00245 [Gammaproteobacteria bacterium]|nr:hypothetical protein [Gammaproteobacteria bacterium]
MKLCGYRREDGIPAWGCNETGPLETILAARRVLTAADLGAGPAE